MPHVIFGFVGWDQHLGMKYPFPKVHMLNCSNSHGSQEKIQAELDKNRKMLGYWFPKRSDLPEKRPLVEHGWQLRVRGENENPYPKLEKFCAYIMERKDRISELEKEAAEFRQLMAENPEIEKAYQKQLAKKESENVETRAQSKTEGRGAEAAKRSEEKSSVSKGSEAKESGKRGSAGKKANEPHGKS